MDRMFCESGFQRKMQWNCKSLTTYDQNSICASVCKTSEPSEESGASGPSEESGASGPGETDPWTTCLQNNPEIYPSCPTPGDPPNGTDLGEKFYSDIEYAKSVLRDWPGFSPHIKCLCESKCGQYLKEVWPGNANDRLCNLYLSDGKKCKDDGCCGAGTTYKDGRCVASWGEKDACEDVGHGKHGWKCGGVVSESCD